MTMQPELSYCADQVRLHDRDRFLAALFAPVARREDLFALYAFNLEVARTREMVREPMMGRIRLQWWRETIEQIAGPGPVRRHDLAEELARLTTQRKDLIAPMNALIDAFDDILDDHLRAGGHQPDGVHERRHLAVESAAMRLAGLALEPAARAEHLDALGKLGEARLGLVAGLEGADARWEAAVSSMRGISPGLGPAMLHLAPDPDDGPFLRRWRIFAAALTRRLGPSRRERESDL